jgi:hypothetical protein
MFFMRDTAVSVMMAIYYFHQVNRKYNFGGKGTTHGSTYKQGKSLEGSRARKL